MSNSGPSVHDAEKCDRFSDNIALAFFGSKILMRGAFAALAKIYRFDAERDQSSVNNEGR